MTFLQRKAAFWRSGGRRFGRISASATAHVDELAELRKLEHVHARDASAPRRHEQD